MSIIKSGYSNIIVEKQLKCSMPYQLLIGKLQFDYNLEKHEQIAYQLVLLIAILTIV